MYYTIVHEQLGRIRVRAGSCVLTKDEASCVARYLRGVKGIIDAQVRAANGSILVEYEKGNRKAALATLDAIDLRALPTGGDETAPDMGALTNDFQVGLFNTTAWHLFKKVLPAPARAVVTTLTAVPYLYRGIKSVLTMNVNVDLLDAVAIAASLYLRDFTTAGSVMFLLKISDILAEYTQSRTRCALRQNMAFYAEQVWLVGEDADIQVALSEVQLGDHVRVRTGQLVPIDGTVIEGTASINEASMTGEAALVSKQAGDTVFAGTALDEGEIVIETTALAGQSRIDSIVDMVENSEEAKAAMQSRAEKLADSLVPLSLGIFGADFLATRSLATASSVLMVDYSCAIKLSTPIAVMSAMREATRRGIVVKGGKYLERLASADTIVFDKTGTLTTAHPVCNHIITFGEMSENAALRLAACLEEHFPHSLARAIVQTAEERGLYNDYELHADVEYIVAHGIASAVDGKEVRIGSAHFIFEDEGVPKPEGIEERIAAEAPTASTVFLAFDGHLEAALCVSDELRPEAKAIIKKLRTHGFERIVMLTGDSENCAAAVAAELGLDEYHAQVLPEDKASYVEALKTKGHTVLMVGDGINDSPALAAADISVAMSDASDIARTVADVTILEPSLESLVVTKDIAVALINRISNAYRFIAGFNTALIALGLLGILAPATTALLHNTSTVCIAGANMRSLLEDTDEQT